MDAEGFVTHFVPDEHKPHTARRVVLGVLTLDCLAGAGCRLALDCRWATG